MTSFLVLLLAYMLSQFFRAFLAVVSADLVRDLGLDQGQLGSLQAAWLVAFALSQFPVGYALDRLGPRRTLAGFLLAAVAGTVLFGLAQGYLTALMALALIGIGCAPILMAGFYLAARLYPPRHFATLSSLLIGFGSIGDPLSGAPLAYFVAGYGWRVTVLGLAGIVALTALLVVLLLKDPPPLPGPAHRHASLLGGIRQIATKRALWLIFPFTFVSYGVTISIRGLWIAPYLQTVHGFDLAATSYAAMAMGGAIGVGALAMLPLYRRVGAKATVAGCAVVVIGACFAQALWGQSSSRLAVGLFLVMGLFGVTYAVVMGHARAFMAPSEIGRGVTFMNFLFMGGAGVMQWTSGRLVKALAGQGYDAQTTYGWLFAFMGLALAATLALYAASPAEPRRDAPAAA
ncbi:MULTISPECIES: MFS transporter [unclassified Bosea (in: a-proteobacteria)]|uniref:MFS transporter n=1 Tax=unclassified Bosea (in: a-proteobacteria) TaxID=2653178 RepID=UPI0009573CFE|nr:MULTISPECIES: MFS transporter [unclassified Bosea (in: a-proteobacteria)]TAJ28724.1 MAG: MFS transporter [Bosea sp. (in: a-proteobacteria)]SIR23912.1 Predicted arabinose efflux permease, MFS family [Bosea sp. TND4EK4]